MRIALLRVQLLIPLAARDGRFQWEEKAGFIRRVSCYNQSPEQCRPFFFVPCAFFNSAYTHFSLLGFP